MMSPSRARTTSPGTRSAASISAHAPSRHTIARSASWLFSAATASAAARSCQNPTPALNTSSTPTMITSAQCRKIADRTR
jgi:hypothetical protein